MGIKDYRRASCCFNCEYFIDYVKASDECKIHNVKIGATSVCAGFVMKGAE